MKQMELNLSSLTKAWIQFLKNNQIVSTQSNPKTARLNYRRQPTVDELIRFLDLNTDFDERDVKAAIKQVLSQTPPDNGANSLPPPEQKQIPQPPKQKQIPQTPNQQPKKKKYSNDDAEDIDFRDINEGVILLSNRLPRFGITEAFYDRQGSELSEEHIKQIFKILLTPKPKKPEPPVEVPGEEELRGQRQEYMRKLKEMIRTVMTPAQRKALWRALSENDLTEAIINKADVGAIFKDAAYLRSKPSGLGKVFKRFREPEINVEDLRKAWANGLEPDGSDGYSDDTADIKRILRKFGFKDPEINKVFAKVFRTDNNDTQEYDDTTDEPTGSKVVQRVADLAKEKGIDKALKSFLEQEYGDELGIGKKATFEDIKDIFEAILQEERTGRLELVREEERLRLGRTKK